MLEHGSKAMIKFIIIKDSDAEGHAAGPGVTSLEHSDHVHSIEVAALWSSIKEGRFERQAK